MILCFTGEDDVNKSP